ncbi:putative ribonuclease H domain-containing protein [Arabidopsis thaliana]
MDELLFEMKESVSDVEGVKDRALIRGLSESLDLGIRKIVIYCDDNELYQNVSVYFILVYLFREYFGTSIIIYAFSIFFIYIISCFVTTVSIVMFWFNKTDTDLQCR